MNTVADYLAATESAMRSLFAGIASYTAMIGPIPVYSGWGDVGFDSPEYRQWRADHADEIAASLARQRQFVASTFAMAQLSGAVLSIAEKAIELYSENSRIPEPAKHWLPSKSGAAVPYCIGREIRGVPLGLVVYAGRNQHAHFEEPPKPIGKAVFERLAHPDGLYDPSFDIENERLSSYAHNITGLLQWGSYDDYLADMLKLPLTRVRGDDAAPASPENSPSA